jgi:hypothetical protein
MLQKKGTDITWKIAITDNGNPVNPTSLHDYTMRVFTFVNGAKRSYWLTFKKTPAAGEKQIHVDGNELVIVIPRSFTATAADGNLNVEVRITESETSGRYENNLRISDVHPGITTSDYFTICELVS